MRRVHGLLLRTPAEELKLAQSDVSDNIHINELKPTSKDLFVAWF